MAWKATVASITGLIAKEEVVMTFGTLYRFGGDLSESGKEIWKQIAMDFGPLRAYSFMILTCFVHLALRRSVRSAEKWEASAGRSGP